MLNDRGTCVLFATPCMISGGFSLKVFKQWAPSEINLITLPGYCMAGTIGHKLMSGKVAKIQVDKETQNVILVHGEKPKMAKLKGKIEYELGIKCYDPTNNDVVHITSPHYMEMDATKTFVDNCINPNAKSFGSKVEGTSDLRGKDTGFIPCKGNR
ncbi:hypothetical protein IFM89_008321 [Coptis chinensis]|uniref:Beta-Casp domain-containing protein n=1 Tax=Coptis chinensis TaxID=261450 RepID=A0A835IAW5_9MAGN|nr:hypothetical protein IFM89_008321 [Coptis chinensis]